MSCIYAVYIVYGYIRDAITKVSDYLFTHNRIGTPRQNDRCEDDFVITDIDRRDATYDRLLVHGRILQITIIKI